MHFSAVQITQRGHDVNSDTEPHLSSLMLYSLKQHRPWNAPHFLDTRFVALVSNATALIPGFDSPYTWQPSQKPVDLRSQCSNLSVYAVIYHKPERLLGQKAGKMQIK